MSHEILVYLPTEPDRSAARACLAELFEGRSFDLDALEVRVRAVDKEEIPKRTRQAALRAAKHVAEVPLRLEHEALSWAIAAALAAQGDGIVFEPSDGVWCSVAKAERIVRSLESAEPEPPDPWEQRAMEEHDQRLRGERFERALERALRADESTFVDVVVRSEVPNAFTLAIAAAAEAQAKGHAGALARAVDAERLERELTQLASAPGLRTRLAFELLDDAGALAAISSPGRAAILSSAREHKNRDLIDELARRGFGG